MIIKFRGTDHWKQWVLIDHVEWFYHQIRQEGAEQLCCQKKILDFRACGEVTTEKPRLENVPPDRLFCELWLTIKGRDFPQQVFANLPVFVLNDEGQTIERII